MTLKRTTLGLLPLSTALVLSATTAAAGGEPTALTLTLKDHQFTPSTVTVPAGAKVRVTLINQDAATEEFDSHDLRVEQLVTPRGKVNFSIGPLKPGEYGFMGEFHSATAQGKVIVAAEGR
jgi:plastocyanin